MFKNTFWNEDLSKIFDKLSVGEREFLYKILESSNHKHDTPMLREFIEKTLETYQLLKFKGRVK